MNVPVESAGGTTPLDLESLARDSLNTLVDTALRFQCPSWMRAKSADEARLTINPKLNEQFRDQLRARGVAASQTDAITLVVDASLTSATKDAFDVLPESPTDNASGDERIWRIEARDPGAHELDLKVTLSALIPSTGNVQAKPVLFSRSVSVDGSENSFNPYRTGVAGILAAMLGGGIAWTLWRSRRSAVVGNG